MCDKKSSDYFGPILLLIGALIGSYLTFFVGDKANKISEDKSNKEESHFYTEIQREYISIFHDDILSENPKRQSAALGLLTLLDPETGKKLNDWARASVNLVGENKEKSNKIDDELNQKIMNRRFKVFVHRQEETGGTSVDTTLIKNSLNDAGFMGNFVQDDPKGKTTPVVYYFHDLDKAGADQIAIILNKFRRDNEQLEVHKNTEHPENPTGFIGVFL